MVLGGINLSFRCLHELGTRFGLKNLVVLDLAGIRFKLACQGPELGGNTGVHVVLFQAGMPLPFPFK